MRSNYTKYQNYKESDVKFIGAVPDHWETWKVTHGYLTIGSGTTPKSDNP
ncbi:MAG: restriction endonuclease subunit S, partial [Cytophagales bacterium]|nr:restriction endonuclease subunit S [Cytophagales bacterium]